MGTPADPAGWRQALAEARLMLLFTPALVGGGRNPFDVLVAVLDHVDLIQVRVKDPRAATSPARELWNVTRTVLARVGGRVPVLVNDRVDVARVLLDEGLAGCHLGAEDLPPREARALLGDGVLLGLSTHTPGQVVAADEEPVDYLGFGPIHATATKGYRHGLGPQAAWVASAGTGRPLFPIGGLDATSIAELHPLRRAAVSSAILAADDPATAAAELAELLADDRP